MKNKKKAEKPLSELYKPLKIIGWNYQKLARYVAIMKSRDENTEYERRKKFLIVHLKRRFKLSFIFNLFLNTKKTKNYIFINFQH